ncbi:MAG: amidohydrolase family protein [Myxococcota bacterium]
MSDLCFWKCGQRLALLFTLLNCLSTGTALAGDLIACPNPPLPSVDPGSEICSVESGSADLLLVGDVLTPGTVYLGGTVLLGVTGTIDCVGCDCAAASPAATRVICPDAVISPGLINAHDHVGWMHHAPWTSAETGVDPDLRFEHRHDWRVGTRSHPNLNAGPGNASVAERTFGELRFVLGGATSFFGSGNAGGLLRDLDSPGVDGLGLQGADYDTFPLGDADGTLRSTTCDYPDPVDALPLDADAYVGHVAEGIDSEARNEFLCLTGGRPDAVDVLDDGTALIHGAGLRAEDVQTMAERGISLVWSPRSNLAIYGETAPVTVMDILGVPIGLGTDWIRSGSMNVLRELACADEFNTFHLGGYFSDEDLWRMATLGSAEALGVDDAIGLLAPGFGGDVAVFAKDGRDAYGAVVGADVGDVALVLRGGQVLSGNSTVVAALEASCDDIGDVCGNDKRVCLAGTAVMTWPMLLSEIGTPAYPAFSCGVPDDEPSCIPMRTLAADVVLGSNLYDGMPTVQDPDGDGLDQFDDNCPDVFNPIRPVDGGVQGDSDFDGIGDACDTTPVPEPRGHLLLLVGLAILAPLLRASPSTADRRH